MPSTSTCKTEDLGRAFHQHLSARSGVRLVDYDNPANNDWPVVTELTFKHGDDEFR